MQTEYSVSQKNIQAQEIRRMSHHKAINTELKEDIKRLERPPELQPGYFDPEEDENRRKREQERCRD